MGASSFRTFLRAYPRVTSSGVVAASEPRERKPGRRPRAGTVAEVLHFFDPSRASPSCALRQIFAQNAVRSATRISAHDEALLVAALAFVFRSVADGRNRAAL